MPLRFGISPLVFAASLLSALACVCPVPGARAADPYPYEMDAGTETALLLGAAACYGAGWWLDRNFEPLDLERIEEKDADHVSYFDRFATRRWSPGANHASDLLVTGQFVAPLGLMLDDAGRRKPGRLTAMYAETVALNTGLTYLLKNAFDRSRPLVYNDDPAIPAALRTSQTARKSFPSGHTANAFAAMVFTASVFETTHPDSPHKEWVWAGCLTSAAITGGLRVEAGRHFPSDVLLGAAVGAISGWLIPHLHEIDASDDGRTAPAKVSIAWRIGF